MKNDKEMTVERSLEIISAAIEQGKRDVTRNAGTPMIVWGTLTFITGVAVCLLWKLTGTPWWNMLWFAMCAAGWVISLYKKRQERRESMPSGFVWQLIKWVWTVFGILAVCVAVIGTFSYDRSVYAVRLPVTAVIILLLMSASAVTAYALKDKAYGCIIGGTVILFNFTLIYPGPYEALCLALSAVTLLIIPGIKINRQAKEGKC